MWYNNSSMLSASENMKIYYNVKDIKAYIDFVL